jgi:hypothetical protein
MAKVALEVITDAFGLSQIYGEDFENLTDTQIRKGLQALSYVVSEKTYDDSNNPYYEKISFSMDYAQPSKFIDNLIGVSTLTFNLDSVRYAVSELTREEFDGSFRANQVYTLPLTYFMERAKGGGNIYVYPFPNQTYEFDLWGKFSLTSVTSLYQDLSLSFDDTYIDYLTFLTARRLCLTYSFEIPNTVTEEINRKEAIMSDSVGTLDTKAAIVPTACRPAVINYAQVNFSPNGFVPSGSF